MTNDLFEDLLHGEDGTTIDFKKEQYRFVKATVLDGEPHESTCNQRAERPAYSSRQQRTALQDF